MRPVRVSTPAVLLGISALLAPTAARAGNGIHERTPVQWPEDTPCMTVIDRSQATVVHFNYEIPYEDTELTPDEVPDSRRHQFVAFCRNHTPQEPLPVWLSWADVDAAVVAGIAEKSDYVDEDVMETNSIYKDCFVRITSDAQRRPITFAEAAKGFDWDTSGIAPGGYIVQGYTWEPAFNIWKKRPGVVHVVDGPDLSAVGPAAALTNPEDVMFGDETLVLQGCARAMPGSTLTGYWSITGEDGLNWETFAEGVPLEGDTIALPFTPPAPAIGQTVALRVDVTDPMQRTFSTFPMALLIILPGSAGTSGDCSDSGNFIGMESCGSDSDSESGGPGGSEGSSGSGDAPLTSGGGSPTTGGGGTAGETGGSTTAPSEEPGSKTGCACRTDGAGGAGTLAGLVLLGLGRRRTRRSA